MIVVRIWGGLGNQMFQYALGYAVAQERGSELKLDTSFYKSKHTGRQTARTLDLYRLPISCKNEISSWREVSFLLPLLQKQAVNYAIRKVLPLSFKIGKFTYVKEDELAFLPEAVSVKNNEIYYDGYWHSDNYFKKYRKDLISQFVFTNDRIDEAYKGMCKDQDEETVAIHIRRGDYITQNNPNARGVEYYQEAIKAISTIVKKTRFCFFSDDLEWVKENFSNVKNVVFANENRLLDDIEEFELMSKCHHQIISNSSFSWWAAWLNQNTQKTVIVPKEWKNKRDMMLDEWIKI